MNNCTHSNSQTAPLFPCKGNLPKPKWRDAIAALVQPAVRIHEYRNLRSAMFYDASREDDRCKPS
jgi:hypothetical protein